MNWIQKTPRSTTDWHVKPSPYKLGFSAIAFIPGGFDALTVLWILSGAVLLVVIGTIFLMRKQHNKKSGLSQTEEKELWQRLEQAAKQRMAKSSRVRVNDLETYRKHAGTAGRARPADSTRSVSALFQTLREDRPSASEKQATGSKASAYPTRDHEPLPSSNEPRDDPNLPQRTIQNALHQPTQNPSVSTPTGKTMIDTPGFPLAPLSELDPLGSLQRPETLDAPLSDLTALLGGDSQDLSFAIRLDATSRLEADLSWVEPASTKPPEWAPPLLRRAQAEKQARRYHRFSRQVALAKHLMHSPDEDLQRKGVEVAIRLEQALHAERAKNRRGRRSLRK